MPTYDYACDKCEKEKEILHSMNETPEIVCDCGEKMRKAISKSFNFILKGSGWSGKDLKQKGYRLKQSQEAGQRMVKNHEVPELKPNYNGEVCKNWEDAGRLAKSKGVDPLRYSKQVDNLKKEQVRIKEKTNKLSKGEL